MVSEGQDFDEYVRLMLINLGGGACFSVLTASKLAAIYMFVRSAGQKLALLYFSAMVQQDIAWCDSQELGSLLERTESRPTPHL